MGFHCGPGLCGWFASFAMGPPCGPSPFFLVLAAGAFVALASTVPGSRSLLIIGGSGAAPSFPEAPIFGGSYPVSWLFLVSLDSSGWVSRALLLVMSPGKVRPVVFPLCLPCVLGFGFWAWVPPVGLAFFLGLAIGGVGTWASPFLGFLTSVHWRVFCAVPSLLAAAELGMFLTFFSGRLAETRLSKENCGFFPFLFAAVPPPAGRRRSVGFPKMGPLASHPPSCGDIKLICGDSSRTLANFEPFLSNVLSGTLAPKMVPWSLFLPKVQNTLV